MDKKFLNAIANGVLQIGNSAAAYLAEQHKTAVAREKLAQMQMQEINKWNNRANLWPDYITFGNAVGRCLESNYVPCGLCRPRNMEELCYSDIDRAIDWEADGTLVYRYEATRRISDLYMGGMKKFEYPRVPVAVIEARLQRELPKYMRMSGCCYNSLAVEDQGEDKVIIILKGDRQNG